MPVELCPSGLLDERHLLEARHNLPDNNMTVHLVLGDINIKRTRRDMQFIFINHRPVQNKSISYHMNQIYRLIMPDDSFPFFAVYLEIPPEEVDVNIHPTKREVKIKDEQNICSILRHLCEETLMKFGEIKEVVSTDARSSLGRCPDQNEDGRRDHQSSVVSNNQEASEYALMGPHNQKQQSLQTKLENAYFVGLFANKFLLFEADRSLLVIDQHAAAERITYEQLIRQMEKGAIEVQHFLSPIVLKLSPQEFLAWEEIKQQLDQVGFSTSQWDKETIAVHTHPQLIKDIEKALRDLLAGENAQRCDFDTLARWACRASVMAGDRLNKIQAEFMREQLLQCLDPFTCPHGRPTVVEMTEGFLDKQFLRT